MGFFDLFAPPKVTAAVPAATNDVEASLAPYFSENQNFYFFGIQTANRAEAMSVPTIARALSIIQTISSLPMHTRNEATGEKVTQPRVINQPDPRIPGSTFWSWIISDLFFHEAAYYYVTERYADTGRIRDGERIAPERVSITTNSNGTEIDYYEIDGTPVDPSKLVVFPNTQEGLLSRAGRTIKAAAALEKASLNFANEPTPLMVLKSNGTSLPADRVAKILNAYGFSEC